MQRNCCAQLRYTDATLHVESVGKYFPSADVTLSRGWILKLSCSYKERTEEGCGVNLIYRVSQEEGMVNAIFRFWLISRHRRLNIKRRENLSFSHCCSFVHPSVTSCQLSPNILSANFSPNTENKNLFLSVSLLPHFSYNRQVSPSIIVYIELLPPFNFLPFSSFL